jgi:hypothetical protein
MEIPATNNYKYRTLHFWMRCSCYNSVSGLLRDTYTSMSLGCSKTFHTFLQLLPVVLSPPVISLTLTVSLVFSETLTLSFTHRLPIAHLDSVSRFLRDAHSFLHTAYEFAGWVPIISFTLTVPLGFSEMPSPCVVHISQPLQAAFLINSLNSLFSLLPSLVSWSIM